MKWTISALFLLILGFDIRGEVSLEEQAKYRAVGWEKIEALIPMRDGVHLYTEVFRPLAGPALPILLTRTPYNASGDFDGFTNSLANGNKELAAEGFIFARQDIRGKFKSEGTFVMLRTPVAEGVSGIDEGTDTYDTIDWLIKNVPNNNGRAALHGTSYLGWTTVMGTLRPHPALKAAVEEASPADMFLGDDFHHNGAFRLSYGYEYAVLLESSKTNVQVEFDRRDSYQAYLKFGSLLNITHQLGSLPTWNDFVDHPAYDAFWQRQAVAPYLTRVAVPMLNVAGWWDQEDFYGPQIIYAALEKHDTRGENFFVSGPWNHGGWNQTSGRRLGPLDFHAETAPYYRAEIKAKFLARYLKDKPVEIPEATTFQTGANKWEQHTSWPAKDVRRQRLFFHSNGRAAFEAPRDNSRKAFDAFVSDPARPVPYRGRPVEPTYGSGSLSYTWLLEDQRFVENRPDVLSYETESLTSDVVITGEIFANLFASTTGTDADWIVKLIDVYPEKYSDDPRMAGYELMVADEVFRGRFRESYERPKAIEKEKILRYNFSLHSINHRFLAGHRIMVQVQSSWFPLIDRNPQKFVPNIFTAAESDFQSATHKIYRTSVFGSYIDLPIRSAN